MNEKPILFSGPMVRAIFDGRKTQTRRVLKKQPPFRWRFQEWVNSLARFAYQNPSFDWFEIKCPYGKVGDRLWVRETHATVAVPRGTTANSFITVYRADNPQGLLVPNKWKPSIFMRRHDSRITLEITGVRVEWLQDISEADARAEGIELTDDITGCADDLDGSYRKAFSYLWDKINGKKHPWASNPWVWVIQFKKV